MTISPKKQRHGRHPLSRRDLVLELNEAIDNNRDHIHIHIRTDEMSLDGRGEGNGGSSAAGLKGTHGRGDFGNFLFWDEPWGRLFRDVLVLPRIMRLMLGMIGPWFRLAGSAGVTMTKGSEGFILHGGGSRNTNTCARSSSTSSSTIACSAAWCR